MSDLVARAEQLRARIEAAGRVDAGEAGRVRDALDMLNHLNEQADILEAAYLAAETTAEKQTLILNTYGNLIKNLGTVLDIVAGTIRAAVHDD